MIHVGKTFNFDGKDWIITRIMSVRYENNIGYMVAVRACEIQGSGTSFQEGTPIDIIANGTPWGYHSIP